MLKIFIRFCIGIQCEEQCQQNLFLKTKPLEIMNDNNFKIGDIITFYGCTNGIPNGGISFGEIIEINGERARVVTGGIDLNTTNHFKQNYMIPIRVRPTREDDCIYRVTLSTVKPLRTHNKLTI